MGEKKGKYFVMLQKLTEDLKKAVEQAKAATEHVDDGGSANMDSVFVRIPRIKEDLVVQAIKDAGCYSLGRTEWIGRGYLISPPVAGQGNKRAKAMEVMKESLSNDGWDVLGFYQLD